MLCMSPSTICEGEEEEKTAEKDSWFNCYELQGFILQNKNSATQQPHFFHLEQELFHVAELAISLKYLL